MTRFTHRNFGFTLVELAMVLFIVSLLIGGLLMPLTAQNEIRGRQETDRALANIREALIGFAVVNGRLPCPVPPPWQHRTGGVDAMARAAGVEATTSPTVALVPVPLRPAALPARVQWPATTTTPGGVTGVLPWATLGMSEADAWGNRYTLPGDHPFCAAGIRANRFRRLHEYPAIAATRPRQPFALCSAGEHVSVQDPFRFGTSMIATAVNPLSSCPTARIPSAPTCQAGRRLPASSPAVTKPRTPTATPTSSATNIDDQLVWLPTSILMGRMLSAGRLP
jgi:type II secretory pathway pseudopilin PulG